MKIRFCSFVIFFLMLSMQLSGDESYLFGKQTLILDKQISQFFPCDENSENEKALFIFLEDFFDKIDADYSLLDYSMLEKGHSFSKGYSVKLQGERDDLLIIGVPLNSPDYKTSISSGSINISIALQLLEIFQKFKPTVSLEFLFLGAERGDDDLYPIGSSYYLNHFTGKVPTIALYLDLSEENELITIKNSSDTDLSPMWLIEDFTDLFMKNNLDFSTESIQSMVYQSGFEKASPIINKFLENEIPTLLLQSRPHQSQPLLDDQWLNAVIESVMSFILDSKEGYEKEWDRHYYITKVGAILLTLGEKEGIKITIGLMSLLALIILFKSRNLHLNLKRFKKHLWTLPLLFFLTFMYLFLSTLIIEEISLIRDMPDLWQQYPGTFLLFKLFAALFLYSSFLFLIRGLALSPSHHFYTYSAFFSVILSMLVVFIFNINYSYFFFWSLVAVSIFMISRKEFVKRIAIALSPLPLIIICYIIFSHPYLKICSFLLMSRIKGNIFLTIIIMPSLMLISSLNYFHHRFHRHRNSFRNIMTMLLWGSFTFIILFNINISSPFNASNRQPIHIDEVIDLNKRSRSILLSSPAPIGDIKLELDKQTMELSDVGRSAEITAPMISDLLNITEEDSTFLDRLSLNYKINAKGSPEMVNIQLIAEKPIILFNSNFPYDVTSDGKSITFYIGKNPLMPLDLKLILPRGSRPDFYLSMSYTDFPYNFVLTSETLNAEKTFTIFKNIKQ